MCAKPINLVEVRQSIEQGSFNQNECGALFDLFNRLQVILDWNSDPPDLGILAGGSSVAIQRDSIKVRVYNDRWLQMHFPTVLQDDKIKRYELTELIRCWRFFGEATLERFRWTLFRAQADQLLTRVGSINGSHDPRSRTHWALDCSSLPIACMAFGAVHRLCYELDLRSEDTRLREYLVSQNLYALALAHLGRHREAHRHLHDAMALIFPDDRKRRSYLGPLELRRAEVYMIEAWGTLTQQSPGTFDDDREIRMISRLNNAWEALDRAERSLKIAAISPEWWARLAESRATVLAQIALCRSGRVPLADRRRVARDVQLRRLTNEYLRVMESPTIRDINFVLQVLRAFALREGQEPNIKDAEFDTGLKNIVERSKFLNKKAKLSCDNEVRDTAMLVRAAYDKVS